MNQDEARRLFNRECSNEALQDGVVAAVTAGGIASAVVLGLNKFHTGFRTKLGVSGKVALVVMPFFFNFVLRSEHSISACRKKKYLLQESLKAARQKDGL
jgi:hypothetical protein